MIAKSVAVLGMTLLAGMAPALGQGLASPEGLWEIETEDSRYQVTLCGPDGDAICGQLVWLKDSDYNEVNKPYLNTMLIREAERAGANRWRGTLNLFGQRAAGTVTHVSDDRITIEGCVVFVLCKSYDLFRM